MDISKKYYLPLNAKYYDEDNVKIRVLKYKKIKWQVLSNSLGNVSFIITKEGEKNSYNG